MEPARVASAALEPPRVQGQLRATQPRVLFLELKSVKGRLSPAQEAFRDTVTAQGFGWALVRSLDDALDAIADHGFTTRVAPPVRRPAP